MAVASFEALCAGFCELVGVAMPALRPDEEGRVAFHVGYRDANVDLVQCARSSPDHLFVLFSLGPLAAEDRFGPGEMRAMLEANFVLQVHPPTFSRNPTTGQAILQYVYPLADATAAGLFELIAQGAEWSAHWRDALHGDDPDLHADGRPHAVMLNLA